jgi:hypothetical protein
MSTQYRLVQSGKTASGGCSAGPRFVRDYYYYYYYYSLRLVWVLGLASYSGGPEFKSRPGDWMSLRIFVLFSFRPGKYRIVPKIRA